MGKLLLLYLFVFVSYSSGSTYLPYGPMHGNVVVCYVASWAVYRPDAGKFDIEDLEPSLCTHLVYAFAGLDENTYSIKSLDPWHDLEKAGYERLVSLKERNPLLVVTVAIGGWNEGSEKYSRMASKSETRAKFVQSVMNFLNTHKFDGLDLDWEYPTKRGGTPEDRNNYIALVKELRDAFEPLGYILTAALAAGKETMDSAYDFTKLNKYLDLIHMKCYDYHGTWDRLVGANAPLKGIGEADVLSVEYTIKYLLSRGVSPYKIVLGVPMYGRNFVLTNPDEKNIQFGLTSTKDVGFAGPWTQENGFIGYNEICVEMTNKSSKWTRHWEEQTATPYLRDGARVIVYDNPRSIAMKIKMTIDYELGGLMVWSIDTDDFRGSCDLEPDTYLDFIERYSNIVDSPVLKEALKNLQLPHANIRENLNRQTSYVESNGMLHLRLPENDFSNYPLLRMINEATLLALEEKRIVDEIDRIVEEKEIKEGSAHMVAARFVYVFVSVLIAFY